MAHLILRKRSPFETLQVDIVITGIHCLWPHIEQRKTEPELTPFSNYCTHPNHTLTYYLPRSQQRLYKRKEQLRLAEMWVTDCMGEVMEATLPTNTAFVLGWPVTNCVAAFSSPEEKNLWYNVLSKWVTGQYSQVQLCTSVHQNDWGKPERAPH